ncbi:GxGYxYP domain-containing protein [Clostridium uliginosum]|uniref:Protein-tyrosine phosphatase n=1 Tax=Clostridium uliginosum TaxID=119641 RepID=A0A1I1HDD6_9CLOT|nr:GxGYxYP domain-containing protein [Clostridium uliginosum]SFC21861.1 Protein-tyrosine phosphatase [Clostridium uliginosum]
MRKNFKVSISIFLILLTFFHSLTARSVIAKASDLSVDTNNVNLILDSSNYKNMTKNFRKSSNLENIQNNKNLNLNGLNTLNISGSQQFSEYSLPLVINSIGTSLPITVIDLRQESHGFINGAPVSWANSKNSANTGLTKEQVLSDENNKLNSIKLNVPITFYNHPVMTTVPTKVQNEDMLVKSKSLSYIRIPVTDGKIPTDDMVDYFVELVKSQSKNTWLHFHCKEGIGRTTTFMIMYDMIKNCNQVTDDDIIKRQLLLTNFDENHIKSFSNNERINFLKNFYKYCKKNNNDFNVKWSDWKKTLTTNSNSFFPVTSIFQNTSNYIKNPRIPTYLYVISQDIMTPSERTMIATLQGVVNNHCSFQIYTLNSSQPDYQIWLDDLKNNYGILYKTVSDPWELLDIFKNYVDGYVLYNNKSLKDPSINNACSLASLNNCIAVDESIQDKVKVHGITKMKGDCRNTDKDWAYNNLWNSGLNHSMLIQLSPDKDTALRDYAIMTKSLVFYEDNIEDTSLRDKIFSSMKKDSICLGWGPDEFINVSTASKHGISMVAADWSYNLTVLSAFPSLPMTQKALMNFPNKKNVHYVTFIMSDGDNQQWNLGTNYCSPKWYGSPYRGKFNLGWSLSPSLYYLSPTVFKLYYKNVAHGSTNDYFIVSPSGNGYMYPSKFDKNALGIYINKLNNYMKKVDEKYIAIIDDSSFHDTNLWDKFTIKPNIQGLFYLDYHKHDNYHGEIIWSNNKPIVSCRDLLWANLESEDELVENINHRIDSGQVDICNSNSYTFVYVHAWSKSLDNIEEVANKLKENPKVEIVTPEIFMELIKKNVIH